MFLILYIIQPLVILVWIVQAQVSIIVTSDQQIASILDYHQLNCAKIKHFI